MSDTDPIAPGRGVETALGGVSREQVQADSPIYAEIAASIEFHRNGECKHGIASAQLVRDVLGSIARMAMPDGVVRRPANRPAELREWPAASIRQLAALCRVYSPGDDVAVAPTGPGVDEYAIAGPPLPHEISHEEQIAAAQPEPTELVEPTADQLARGEARAQEVAALLVSQLGTQPSGNGHAPVFHAPEHYDPAADLLTAVEPVFTITFHAPEPWRGDSPPTPMSATGDDIPF